jgi:hypothetical protein
MRRVWGALMREKLEKELKKVKEEIERASADGNSDLAHLEGWEQALRWVLREVKKGERVNA